MVRVCEQASNIIGLADRGLCCKHIRSAGMWHVLDCARIWQPLIHSVAPPLRPPSHHGTGQADGTPAIMAERKLAKTGRRRRHNKGNGQADKLPGAAWALFNHVQATGPSWVYPVVCLGHLLCIRVTEVLSLSGKDFDLAGGVVQVRAPTSV